MRTIGTMVLVILLSGCASMTPTQKRVAIGIGAALAVGFAAAHGHSGPPDDAHDVTIQPVNCQTASCK